MGRKLETRSQVNAVKRKIRASLFQLKDRISPEIDFIVIARPGLEKLSSEEVKANLTHVLNLAKNIRCKRGN